MDPALSLVRLHAPDLPAVVAIENACYSQPWSEATLLNELTGLPHSRVWGIRQAGELLGYAVVWVIADEGHLANLAVTPGARRRGLARRLLDESLLDARRRGATAVYLEVRASNRAAQALYLSAGFRLIGTRAKYYENNQEDAVLMSLAFQGLYNSPVQGSPGKVSE